MTRVNLIPARLIAAKRARRRLRRWGVALAAYTGLLLGACAASHALWGSGHDAASRDLEAARQATKQSNDALAAVRREIAAAQGAQRTIQVVTDQPDWSQLMAALANALGDQAVLRDARLTPQAGATAPPPPPPPGTPAKPDAAPRARFKLELRGLARSQAAVSRFVAGLESAGAFDEVKLVRTGREPFLATAAVSFELECTLTDEAREVAMPSFDPKNLKSWQIDVGGALLAVLLACAAYWLKVAPDLQRHDDARARADQLHAEADKRRQLEASLRTAGEQLKSVQQYVARHKFAPEPAARLNEHVAALGDLAARAGLQLDGVEPGRETAGPSYTTVPIRMTGRGRFQHVVSYLAAVRAAMPDKGVSGWEMAATPSPHAPTATFTFNLVWYAAPKPQVARN